MSDNELLLAMSDMMDQKLQPINSRLDKMDSRLDQMDGRLDKLESDVSMLKREMRVVKDKVSNTYNLALEAWGQSTENRTWLEHNQATG